MILVISDRLLFFTANDVERLDPALRRPGRMDVWVNFTHVTKWQAACFFKHVFLSRPSASSPNEVPPIDTPRGDSLRPRRKAAAHAMQILEEQEVVRLAQRFADAIPEGVLSVRFVSPNNPGICSHAQGFAVC
jgi:mitochondrial chaperone BCS1